MQQPHSRTRHTPARIEICGVALQLGAATDIGQLFDVAEELGTLIEGLAIRAALDAQEGRPPCAAAMWSIQALAALQRGFVDEAGRRHFARGFLSHPKS
jgi:hypothetical protein